MNHSAVSTATCVNCHSGATYSTGVIPVPKSPSVPIHLSTNADCYTCHGYVYNTFKINPVKMNHAGILSNCQSCHGGQTYQGVTPKAKPATGHIATTGTADCVPCHTIPGTSASASFAGKNSGWTMGAAGHAAAGVTSASACISCHNGQTFVTGVVPAAKPATHITTLTAATDCNICHANFNTFAGQGVGWTMQHSGVSTATCTNCHNNQTFANGVLPVSKGTSPAHIATTADCLICHGSTGTSLTTFNTGLSKGLVTMHGAVTNPTVCGACHARTATTKQYQGVAVLGFPSNHMLIGAATDCYVCHTNYTTFAGKGVGWTMSTTQHTGLPGVCTSCHTGQTFANGVTPTQKTAITGHIPTTLTGFLGDACSNCHTSTAANGGFKTVKMNHGSFGPPAPGGGVKNSPTSCSQCHDTSAIYKFKDVTVSTKTAGNHEGSKAADDCNKSGCHRPTGNKGTLYTKWN
jgi:hypothetical protein